MMERMFFQPFCNCIDKNATSRDAFWEDRYPQECIKGGSGYDELMVWQPHLMRRPCWRTPRCQWSCSARGPARC